MNVVQVEFFFADGRKQVVRLYDEGGELALCALRGQWLRYKSEDLMETYDKINNRFVRWIVGALIGRNAGKKLIHWETKRQLAVHCLHKVVETGLDIALEQPDRSFLLADAAQKLHCMKECNSAISVWLFVWGSGDLLGGKDEPCIADSF